MHRVVSAGVALLLLLLTAGSSQADTGTSVGEGGGEGGGPFAGLLQAPEASLFTGGLTQVIPIQIPPGPKNATPDLKLVYSSAGAGPGFLGEGWSLPMGTIERSTKSGTTRCLGDSSFDNTNDFILTLNGAVVELSPAGTSGGDPKYQPRTDQSYLEAIRHGNTWEVIERSGMRYFFGTTTESRLWRNTDVFMALDSGFPFPRCDYTAVWGLTRVEDPNGNRADITYKSGKKTLLPDVISYGGHVSVAHPFEVRFFYESHSDPKTSYRHGLEEEVTDLIDRVEVRSNSSLVRTYDLQYDHDYTAPPNGCDASRAALLCAVSVDALPTQTFEYSPGDFGLGEVTATQPAPAPPSQPSQAFKQLRSATANAETKTSTMDMNGDGLLDFVNANDNEPGSWEVWFGNRDGSGFNVYRAWATPAGVENNVMRVVSGSGSPATRKETMDLTGDGIADFVDAHPTTYAAAGNKWVIYPGYCSTSDPYDCGFSASPVLWPAPEAELGEERTNSGGSTTIKKLLDMNGDGRPDLVKSCTWDTQGNCPTSVWKVWLNNGSGFATTYATDMRFNQGIAKAITGSGTSGGLTQTGHDVFDFNGDGLPDLVGSFNVYINDGLWFRTPGIPLPGIQFARTTDAQSGETIADFLDVNADGLPDRVEVTSGGWTVQINRGTSLAPAVAWPGASGTIRKNNRRANTKWDVLDWNGDGFIDRVDASEDPWVIQLGLPSTGPGIRPYLMTRSRNGIGGVSETRYAPSTAYLNTRLPFTSWVVTGTRRTDGLCSLAVSDPFTLTGNPCLAQGHELVSTLEYEKGYFDGSEREFRGFGKVTERFPGEPQRYRVVEFNQATHTRGQIESEEVWATTGSRASREDYTWATHVPDGGVDRTQVYLSEHVSQIFDLDTPSTATQCTTKRNELPDEWGRVTRSCATDCSESAPGVCTGTGLSAGTVITETSWADLGASGIRERPEIVTTKYVLPGAGGTSTLTVKHYAYDALGNVTSVRTEGLGSADATVTNQYDEPGSGKPARGNITKVVEPEQFGTGVGTTSSFTAATSYLFPTTETSALQLTATKVWDLRYGKEIQVTGPNGEVSVATYDAAGRTLCEAKPGSSCSSGIPTVQYTYVCAGSSACGASSPAGGFEGKLSYVEVRTRETGDGNPNGYLRTRSFVDALGRE